MFKQQYLAIHSYAVWLKQPHTELILILQAVQSWQLLPLGDTLF